MKSIKLKTPAKINLTLEVLSRRADGFHEIESIMQTVGLYDLLHISIEENKTTEILIDGTSDKIPYNKDNICYLAANIFLEKIKKTAKVRIHIEKNIPVSAGLAGGSSNAAGVIWGLNKLFGNPLNKNELLELCAQIGSDVSFCLIGGCALAQGRGEILEPLNMLDFKVDLKTPENCPISAKEAYQKFAKLKNKPKTFNTQKMIQAIANQDKNSMLKLLNNHLESVILENYPPVLKIKEDFLAKNGDFCLMSGSGSTVFSISKNASYVTVSEGISELK